ncbi:Embryonic stem cell-specific 5-hydroxymethylcytosine-binding protein, partial [Orchesella cincta]
TLAPDVICRACTYKDPSSDKYKKPNWKEHPESKDSSTSYTYYASANIAPTKFTPVLIRSKRSSSADQDPTTDACDREVMPMMFGMIPYYHKNDAKSHGLSTNNCRLEGLLESKLYKRSWDQRKFCVILAQGFYEWQTVGATGKGKKQPYLIYMPQGADDEKPVNIGDKDLWEKSEWSEEEGWNGPNILKMAGLYDVWKAPNGDEVYSYTIITMESNDTLSWLHDRMPAILDNEESVAAWLNATPKTSTADLMSILKPVKSLQWHPVDPKVGNSRCHDMDCMELKKPEERKPTFMDSWVKRTPAIKVKAEESTPDEASAKKLKTDN